MRLRRGVEHTRHDLIAEAIGLLFIPFVSVGLRHAPPYQIQSYEQRRRGGETLTATGALNIVFTRSKYPPK